MYIHKINIPRAKFVIDDELDNDEAVIRARPTENTYKMEDYCLELKPEWASPTDKIM